MHQLKWNKELSVGVPLIDDQHKELIRIVNGLMKGIARGSSPNTINNILGKLREYTVFHFNSEEKLMEEMRYPDRGEHEIEHRRLKTNVKEFQRRIYKKTDVSPTEVFDFLKEWLLTHILSHDINFANFIRDKQSKDTEPAEETPTPPDND
ncbi:bacteriohemerythrin [uncultured Pseudodesulfovibrio sp.]|uniref:bacteriohemerythrin n=1 Tax=uncultured Pseudodesulfovibrio sp. TaxID=2035858 RepID=UPI0029C6D0D9|nr:bacteriohemerythrin [uncultured Pseudodesulfovibrio sp.]